MRLLADTHLLLWWLAGGVGLTKSARAFLADTSNQVYFSAASIWEVSIKAALGKIEADPSEMLDIGPACVGSYATAGSSSRSV